MRRIEREGDRRVAELAFRLRRFEAREARVVAQLRSAGFLRGPSTS